MSGEQTEKAKNPHRHIGIRWRLFAYLAAFTLLILLTIWIFQIRLLGYFYEREKFSELESAAKELSDCCAAGEWETHVNRVAQEKGICISVYFIEDGKAKQMALADVNPNCVIHHLSNDLIAGLYDSALQNGGVYDRRMEFDNGELVAEDDGFHLPGLRDTTDTVNAIYVRLVDVDGGRYFLLLDSEITPLKATVNTLQMQFLWISISLLFCAFLLAFILSKLVATPLAEITKQAGTLAEGNYKDDFRGHGYREVEELARALNYAAKEIGATDRLQKELIANISHDLRTPLTMIKGYSEIMRDIPGENSPENAQIIIDETTRLSELVSDLLDISKLQSGAKKPELSVFDLTATVEETMRRYDALVRHDGYRIEFEAKEHAMVNADRTMILQVVYNLINNAVNYTGDSKRVRVTQTVENGVVRLDFRDDGAGIPPDLIEHIWDRYYRVDKVHKRAVMGTGLGLSIVKSILEAHQARYGVESALGVGSVFWFSLNLVHPEELPPES